MLKIPIKIISEQTEKPTENHTIVYIDGQNFLHRCAESLIKSGAIQDRHELLNIDIKYIFKKLFPLDSLEIRCYGVTKVKFRAEENSEFNEKTKHIIDDLRHIKSNLSSQGIILRNIGRLKIRTSEPCRNCGATTRRIQEKGVDVGLAIEMVEDSALKLTDKVVLVSSDTDMVPAIEAVKQLGVKVVYAGVKGFATKSLARCAGDFRIINNLTILEAYESAMNFPKNS